MLARQANLLLRVPASASSRLLRPSFLLAYQHDLSALAARSYSTPGRPKKAVGEPSRPVKRSVKKAPATKASVASDEGSTTTTSKKQKATAKKAVAKSKKKKPKTVKAKKAPLTAEEREIKRKKAQDVKNKQKTAHLKALALQPPPRIRINAFNVVTKEVMDARVFKGLAHSEVPSTFSDCIREASAKYKALSPSELEHYNHLANVRTEQRYAAYKDWVESHTPDQIHTANRARLTLNNQLAGSKGPRQKDTWPLIRDERAVKRAMSAYKHFIAARFTSPDFHNIHPCDRIKLLAKEWGSLEAADKEKYTDLAQKDKERWMAAFKEVYGRDASLASRPLDTAAAAQGG